MLATFLLIDFTWVFFRADDLAAAAGVLRQLFVPTGISAFFDGSFYAMGLSRLDMNISLLSILALLIVDVLHERGVQIRGWILAQGLWLRWTVYLAAVFVILIFGFSGPNYDAAQFISFQF